MANRRMFSKSIVRTDRFLDMPQSVQNLYFHLGLEADDDGFITPRMIMRSLGSTEDDIRMLVAKNFVIPFETGVIVITDWKENNYIQKDRYIATKYNKEFSLLDCEKNVYKLDTQVRLELGKDRLGKSNNSLSKNKTIKYTDKDKELVELLHNTIISRYPHLSGKFNLEKDCEEMNKLHRLDKWSYEQIEYITRWSQQDDFWKQNILSVSKLRKQFDKLVIKSKGETKSKQWVV